MSRSSKIFWAVSLAALLVISAGLIIDGYAIWYTIKSSRILAQALEKRATLEMQRQNIGKANLMLEDLEPAPQSIQASFVDPSQPLAMIKAIETLAERTEIAVEISLANSAAAPEQYRLSATGAFGGVMAFSKAFEALPHEIELTAASLSAASGKNITLGLGFRLIRP